MWMDEKPGARVTTTAHDEILATGATTVATACPYCTVMIKDAVDDRDAGERVQVKNCPSWWPKPWSAAARPTKPPRSRVPGPETRDRSVAQSQRSPS